MVAMAEVKGILPSAGDEGWDCRPVPGRGAGGEGSSDSPSQPDLTLAVSQGERPIHPHPRHPHHPSSFIPHPSWGLLAEYRDAAALRAAAEKVRNAGYKRWDCYSPFPVHGLDRAMGVRPTRAALAGAGGGTGRRPDGPGHAVVLQLPAHGQRRGRRAGRIPADLQRQAILGACRPIFRSSSS